MGSHLLVSTTSGFSHLRPRHYQAVRCAPADAFWPYSFAHTISGIVSNALESVQTAYAPVARLAQTIHPFFLLKCLPPPDNRVRDALWNATCYIPRGRLRKELSVFWWCCARYWLHSVAATRRVHFGVKRGALISAACTRRKKYMGRWGEGILLLWYATALHQAVGGTKQTHKAPFLPRKTMCSLELAGS